ncbi:MAG TPA: flagellin [Arcobacter sp.]|nr:flagellin [Arcobacter sp.]HIP55980.1 flagellin [Arcobacter sp.]
MQLGRLEMMDQSKVEHTERISKIQNVDKQHTIVEEEKYKDLEEGMQAKKINEVILDNVKFGFNKNTKEFFVRLIDDGVEYQFSTDQFMRLKTQLNEDLDKHIKKI